ncbi:hypothetical protein CMI37_15105 [Candidatus Pacearchaeota archaeon]|nr:hypothetical protein [Candidatus Pacearchaeota archaeon]|tara:strand:- start:3275 stop:3733 length:459 start_codon:yes stop_codon:yes gene_type:complete
MTFKERGKIGDNAESRAESYFSKAGHFIARYGMDAKDIKNAYSHWGSIPSLVTGTPDFILVAKDKSYFLEVKACGQFLKFKLHDIDIYKEWNEGIFPDMKLLLFVYSGYYNEHYILTFDKILKLVKENNYRIERYENNNRPYYEIPLEDLEL